MGRSGTDPPPASNQADEPRELERRPGMRVWALLAIVEPRLETMQSARRLTLNLVRDVRATGSIKAKRSRFGLRAERRLLS